MQLFKNIRTLPVVMLITIIGITSFQAYWLHDTYEREKRTLEIRSNINFRETVYELQASKLNIDSLMLSDSNRREVNQLRVKLKLKSQERSPGKR
jgi:two-component system phosphate regulon sensor histidine kinase PhoR